MSARVTRPCILVDLTRLASEPADSEARLRTQALLPQLVRLAPDVEFTLLTSAIDPTALAWLDGPNVTRQAVAEPAAPPPAAHWLARLRRPARRVLPARARRYAVSMLARYRERQRRLARSREDLGNRLLFCPLGASSLATPGVPVVGVVASDVAVLAYPRSFARAQRQARHEALSATCRMADRLVCSSDYVRELVQTSFQLAPERVVTIRPGLLGLAETPDRAEPTDQRPLLAQLGLAPDHFLLCSAGLQPHSNYRMLLTAFGQYRHQHPGSTVKLVCVGGPAEEVPRAQACSARMGLAGWVSILGPVPEPVQAALLWQARACVHPSLFEESGQRVVQAMAAGKPVACSNAASLPEVVGDAGMLFDARRPHEIADAIARLVADDELLQLLARRGRERARRFGTAASVAQTYLCQFYDLLGCPSYAV
jgi:glycosyltransferase involved in cell wall biosynthesis